MSNSYPYTPPTSDPRYPYTINSNTSSHTASNPNSSDLHSVDTHQLPGQTNPDPKPPEWPTRPKQNSQRTVTNLETVDSSYYPGSAYASVSETVVPSSYQQPYSGTLSQYGTSASNERTESAHIPQQPLSQYPNSPGASVVSSQYSHQYSSTNPYLAVRGYDSPMHNDERDEDTRTEGMVRSHANRDRKESDWSDAIWSEQYRRYYRTRIDEQGKVVYHWH